MSVPDLRLGLVAAVREAAHELLVQVRVERHRHLAVRRRVGVLGVDVRRRLVVADVERVRIGADLVERAAQEQLVARQPRQVERRGRHEEDLVARAGEEEFLLAAELHVGDDRLPRAFEVQDGVPNLLHLPPQRRRTRRSNHDTGDPGIDLRLSQRVDERPDRRLSLEELPDDARRIHLLEVAVDAQHEGRVPLDSWRAANEQRGEDQAGRRNGHGREDEEDHDDDTAPDCHWSLRSQYSPWCQASACEEGSERDGGPAACAKALRRAKPRLVNEIAVARPGVDPPFTDPHLQRVPARLVAAFERDHDTDGAAHRGSSASRR